MTGGLRASQIVLSDTKGAFAAVSTGLPISWNPAGAADGQDSTPPASKRVPPFAAATGAHPRRRARPQKTRSRQRILLPVKIDIDNDRPAGDQPFPVADRPRRSTLSAGRQRAGGHTGGVGLISRSRRHDVAGCKADRLMSPSCRISNQLRLKAKLSGTEGRAARWRAGAAGPTRRWKSVLTATGWSPTGRGQLQASLDGQQRASIEARHTLTPDSLHHVDLKGGGDLSSLLAGCLPSALCRTDNIDVAANLRQQGQDRHPDRQSSRPARGCHRRIEHPGSERQEQPERQSFGNVGTGRFPLAAWPSGEARFLISGVNLALTGDAKASCLNASASLDPPFCRRQRWATSS